MIGAAGRKPSNIERHLRREVRIHIPRKQVSGKAEDERDEQQEHADDPLQFARRFVRAEDQHLQQMQEDQRDHRRCAPVVNRQQRVRERIQIDRAGRFPSRRGRRRVEEREENARDDLHDHREQRRASEYVPVASAARDVFGEEILRHRHEAGARFEPVEHRCVLPSPYAWYEMTMRAGTFGWYWIHVTSATPLCSRKGSGSRPRGAGPATCVPSKLYCEP